jgi:hypothetical protein
MRHERHREAEMEAGGIPHGRFAHGQVGMHAIGGLNMGEGRNDDAPDALDGIKRKDAAMPLHQLAHHRDFARRPECGAGFLGALHRDQVFDDFAALDQERMHGFVDPVDFRTQGGQRRGGLWGLIGRLGGLIGHGSLVNGQLA